MFKKRFITITLVIIFMTTLIPPTLAAEYGNDHTVYFTGYGHIDTAWQWTYTTSIEEFNFGTWLRQFGNMEKYPDYVFSATSPVQYAWAEEYYPSLLDEVKEKVAQGQWDITGGEWVEAETLISSGESAVRQFLMGQQYYQDTFGQTAKVAFLPDDPGHSWIYPQIMAKSGIEMFTATRISALGGTTDYDGTTSYDGYNRNYYRSTGGIDGYDSFVWKGVDGTEIPAYKPSVGYTGSPSSENIQKTAKYNSDELGLKKSMFYGGDGDMGGGPKTEHLDTIARINEDRNQPNVVYAKAIEYYNQLTDEEKTKIKNEHTWDTEIYYNHEAGLYTTGGEIKKYNNDNEVAADAAEKLSSIAMWLGAADYPTEKINFAWDKILMAQQHDIVTGCGKPEVYEQVHNDEEIALEYFGATKDNALAALTFRADTHSDNADWIPVTVFNPLSYLRTEIVETDVTFQGEAPEFVKVYAGDNEIPAQIAKRNGNTATVVFAAEDVPSVGYKVFYVEASDSRGIGTDISATSTKIESDLYEVTMDDLNGNIVQVKDKTNNRNAFESDMELHLFRDYNWDIGNYDGSCTYREALAKDPNTKYDIDGSNNNGYWGAWEEWIIPYEDLMREPGRNNNTDPDALILNAGAPVGQESCQVSTEITESGPVRSVYKITKTFKSNGYGGKAPKGTSTIEQYVTVYNNINRVDISMHVDWQESRHMLKAAFHLEPTNPNATFDLSYGTIERGNRSDFVREVSAQKWTDITEPNGSHGVSILSENKYGWDKVDDNTLRLSLLRSTKNYSDNADMGIHDFTMSIYPHDGTWQTANTPREADSMAKPLLAMQTTQHEGALGKEFSFVSTDKSNIVVSALKKAEKGDDFILRLYESTGAKSTPVTVNFADSIISVKETNLIEMDDLGTISSSGNSFDTALHQYELKTFRVKLADSQKTDTKPIVTPVDLTDEYNLNGITDDYDYTSNSFAVNGNSIPGELFPETIMSEGICFDMGPKTSENIVKANGQTVPISDADTGTHSVYLLANAEGGPVTGNFTVNYTDGPPSVNTISVSDWSKYYGQWGWDKNNDRLAHVFTHTHSFTGNLTYSYANLFMYSVAVDPGRTISSITLPDNDKIRVFAISTAAGGFMPAKENFFDADLGEFVDDMDGRISYNGRYWHNYTFEHDGGLGINDTAAGAKGGTRHVTNDDGEPVSIEFIFYGTRFDVFGESGSDSFKVFIDGNESGRTHQNLSGTGQGLVVYTSDELDVGWHKILLWGDANSDWKILEGFQIYGSNPITETNFEIVNDNDPDIVYGEEGWGEGDSEGLGGHRHYTNQETPYVEYEFTGTGIEIYGEKGKNKRDYKVIIDGNEAGEALSYCNTGGTEGANDYQVGQLLYRSIALESGKHTIRLEATKNRNSDSQDWTIFEGFKVYGADVPPKPEYTIIDDRDPAIRYVGNWDQHGDANVTYNGITTHSVNNTRMAKHIYENIDHNGSGIYAELWFYGSQVQIVGEQGYNKADFLVYIDDMTTPYGETDCFQGEYDGGSKRDNDMACGAVVFDSQTYGKELEDLGPGKHRIRLVAKNNSDIDPNSNEVWAILDALYIWDYKAAAGLPDVSPPPYDERVVDDRDSKLEYTGTWTQKDSPSAYNETLNITNEPGASVSYTFVGTSANVYAETSTKLAKFNVWVDGVMVETSYNATIDQKPFNRIYSTDTLSLDRHTIKIELVSGELSFDGFLVEEVEQFPPGAIWVDDRVTGSGLGQFNYSGWETGGLQEDAYNNTLHIKEGTGGSCVFRFEGTGFFIIAQTNDDHSDNVKVVIDGKTTDYFSEKTGSRIQQEVVYSVLDLPFGEHTVSIENQTGNWMTLDALVYCPNDFGAITGTVYDAEGGAPVENASVSIVGESETTAAKTGSNGKFSINAPQGEYTLLIKANGYKNTELKNVSVVKYRTTIAEDIRLEKGGWNAGINVTDNDGNPVSTLLNADNASVDIIMPDGININDVQGFIAYYDEFENMKRINSAQVSSSIDYLLTGTIKLSSDIKTVKIFFWYKESIAPIDFLIIQ